MNNLRITNEDFFNYIQSLTPSQLKGLNYKLENVEPMKITTSINGDTYARFLVRIERKGKTLIVKSKGEYAEEEKYTFSKEDYSLKGCNFGGINFNTHNNYRVREI